jgi:hypothetical protein
VCATVAAAGGCGGQSPDSATPPSTAATTTTVAPTLDTVSYATEARQARASGTLPWFCKAQGLGGAMDHGHQDGLANDAYAGKKKGDLSPEDCDKLAGMFDQVIASVKPYKTRADLKKAGAFAQAVQFVPGLGTHDTLRAKGGGFATRPGEPPGPPMFLQYGGDGDDAPLVGMSWLTFSQNGPPPGFPGDNDWWHTHSTLCYSGPNTVIGNELSDADCAKIGGTNRALPGVWMSHAWIVPGYEDRYDVFSGAYMCVKGDGKPIAPDDPCHNDQSDPEHAGKGGGVPMPGMDHGNGSMPPMDHGHGPAPKA